MMDKIKDAPPKPTFRDRFDPAERGMETAQSEEETAQNSINELHRELAKKWQDRDLSNIVNHTTEKLMNLPGDWDPPEGVTPKRSLITMTIGIPDSHTLPKQQLLDSVKSVIAKKGEAAFVYGFGMGYTRLRAQLAERYSRIRGMEVTADSFQLTNGSAGGIDLICRTLINPGDVIIAESPTYMGTLRNFRGVMADIHSIPMDKDGLLTDLLEQMILELKSRGKTIKFIYTISTFQNPTGANLSLQRRIALLKIAARHDILILDDDAYGELYFGEQPPAALSALSGGYGVITVGTLSKVLATGLRLGWIHAEPAFIKLIGTMRFAMGLNQMVVRMISSYMQDDVLDRHIADVRKLYHEKMLTLCNGLHKYAHEHVVFDPPEGGFYLWLKLKGGLTAEQVWRTATEEGVALTRGTSFFPARDPAGEHLRIAYPWTPREELEEGARRLGLACERVSRGKGI
jgi:2-aminoadipate transaminase